MLKFAAALLLGLTGVAIGHAADAPFEAGKQYFVVEPAQPTNTGDKIEVLEVFSWACPACNAFQATMKQVKKALPANVELNYLPAAFRPDEDWPVFQRTYYAAKALGVDDKAHDAMFDAVWGDDGTLRIADAKTHRPVKTLPTVEDIGAFFAAKFGIKAEDFVGTANSFAINAKMKQADAQIKAYGVDSTPTLIVNGKYRFTAASAGGIDKVVPLLQFLVAKESAN